MSGLILKKILTASLLVSSSANANDVPYDEDLTKFATMFYTPGMYNAEKARVNNVLSIVSPEKRAEFSNIFGRINNNLSSSFFCDGILESLVRLDPSDWRPFASFVESLLSAVVTSKGSLYGAAFSRIVTNVAYVKPEDRKAFIELTKQQVNASYSTEDNSWLVAKMSRIHREHYENISVLLNDVITPEMTAYDRSLFFVPLDHIKDGDKEVLKFAKQYIPKELSAEHQSSIINVFAMMNPDERPDFINMIDILSPGKDINYVAWLIESLSVVPKKWRQEAADEMAGL